MSTSKQEDIRAPLVKEETTLQVLGTDKKRKRSKKLADDFASELKQTFCVKRSVGMSSKRGVSCSNILSLLFLFLLGGLAGNIMLLQTTVELGKIQALDNPDATPNDKALHTFEQAQIIELKAVIFGMVFSILFGFLYEMCSRKCVLIFCFTLLAIGMALPFIPAFKQDTESVTQVLTISRIIVSCVIQAILANPLLNDYVKRRNRGWAAGWQRLGFTIGEIASFVLIALEVHKDEEAADKIYFTMIALIFVMGLFIAIFAITDRKVPRDYTKDEKGELRRYPRKLEKDDDENDTGSDIELKLPDGCAIVKAKKASVWSQMKIIWGSKRKLIREDPLNWYLFYASFVNSMAKDNFKMIMLVYLTSFIVPDDQIDENPFSMTEDEQVTRYKYMNTISLQAVLFAAPVYGFLTDSLTAGTDFMIAYAWRAISCYAIWAIQDPNRDALVWMVAFYMLSANFQEIMIDSLFSKRIPGDVRGAMNGLRSFCESCGHFVFALIALKTVMDKGIEQGLLWVAIFDTSMVVLTFVFIGLGRFRSDVHAGDDAKKKGKQVDAAKYSLVQICEIRILREELKNLKEGIAEEGNENLKALSAKSDSRIKEQLDELMEDIETFGKKKLTGDALKKEVLKELELRFEETDDEEQQLKWYEAKRLGDKEDKVGEYKKIEEENIGKDKQD